MYERIAVALDGSEIAETALTHVAELAERLDAEVVLIRVVHAVTELGGEPPELPSAAVITPEAVATVRVQEETAEAEAYLAEISTGLNRKGVHSISVLRAGPVARGIIAAAVEHGCDLIAITEYGAGGAHTRRDRNVFGGVADEVLRTSPLPVLIVRPWAEIGHD